MNSFYLVYVKKVNKMPTIHVFKRQKSAEAFMKRRCKERGIIVSIKKLNWHLLEGILG